MRARIAMLPFLACLLFIGTGSILMTGCDSGAPVTVPSTDPTYLNYYELGDWATIGSNAVFTHPAGIAVVNHQLWVVDQGNNSLQQWNFGLGAVQKKVITSYNGGNTFNNPWGIGVDPATNNFYVAGGLNGNVVVFDSTGTYLTTLTAGASDVRGVAINAAGTTAYVTDYSTGGYIYTIGGTTTSPTFSFVSQFGTSGTGKLTHGLQGAIDASGNVWVADFGATCVKEYSSTGTYIQKLTSSKFVRPSSLMIRVNGDILVTDEGADDVYAFSSTTKKKIGNFGGNPGFPEGIANDGSFYYVSDWSGARVIVYN